MRANPLAELPRFGQSPWLDFIARDMLESGELGRLIAAGSVRGVTSNPNIFEQAITTTAAYDADIARLARAGHTAEEAYEALAIDDVRAAADLLRGVYDEADGTDGFVSFEVSPRLARDAHRTCVEARRVWAAIGRPNVLIKVPGTREGLAATTTLLGEGINVNVTLLFALDRYAEVLGAYADGLHVAREAGLRLERIASVASFFVSRIDTAVDAALERRAETAPREAAALLALRGEGATASARSAYGTFAAFFEGRAFRGLAALGARRQRLLWASTGTKSPRYGPIKYVEPLVGAYTINTMPLATLKAYREHGEPARRLPDEVGEGAPALAALARAGIDLGRITDDLLEVGIDKFTAAYDRLLTALEERGAARGREAARVKNAS